MAQDHITNSAGVTMAEIQTSTWSETPANNTAATPDGWPEGQPPSTVNDCARTMMAAIKREWNRAHPTVTSAGTTTALTLTYANAPVLADGIGFTFRLGTDIGAGATLAVNGGTGRALCWRGVAVANGQYRAGDIVTAYYNAVGTPQFDLGTPARAIEQGLHTMLFTAGGISQKATGGATRGAIETTTNKLNFATLDFDASAIERAQIAIVLPKGADPASFTWQAGWTAGSSSGAVVWGARAVALSDDDALDAAFGAAVTVTDTLTAVNDLMVTAVSSPVTVAGGPSRSDTIVVEVYRDATAGADTLAADARLLWMKLFWTIDAGTDA